MADRTVTVALRADIGQFQAGMLTAARAASGLGSNLEGVSARQRAALGAVTTAAVAAGSVVVAGFGLAARAAMTWEQALANANTTIHATPAQLNAIGDGLRALARNTPESREALAGIAEEAGRLGISAGHVVAFTDTISKLSTDTNLSATDAARDLARIGAATATPVGDFDRLASSIVAAGNKSRTGEDQIVQSALQIAGAAHSVGLSAPDIIGFGNALASLGGGGSSGLAITALFTKMNAAVASGGQSLTVFARLAGETTTQFQRDFAQNATGAILKVFDGLHKLQGAGGDLLSTFNDIGLGGTRGLRVLASLATQSDSLRASVMGANQAYQQNTALNAEAATRWATTSAQLKIQENRLSDVALTLGTALLPVVTELLRDMRPFVSAIADAAKVFAALPSPIRNAAVSIGLVDAAGLVALGTIGKLVLRLAELRAGFAATNAAETASNLGNVGGAAATGTAEVAAGTAGAGATGATFGLGGAGAVLAGSAAVASGALLTYVAALEVSKHSTDEQAKHISDLAMKFGFLGDAVLPSVGGMLHGFSDVLHFIGGGKKSVDDLSSSIGASAKVAKDAAAAHQKYDDAVAKFGGNSRQAVAAGNAWEAVLRRQGTLTTADAQIEARAAAQHDKTAASIRSVGQVSVGMQATMAQLAAVTGMSAQQIATAGAAGKLTAGDLQILGLSAKDAQAYFASGAGSALTFAANVSSVGAYSAAAAIGVMSLAAAMANLQSLQLSTQQSMLGGLSAIDNVNQAFRSAGGGGGGGGAKKTMQDLLDTSRQLPDALQKVADAERSVQDATRGIQDAATNLREAEDRTVDSVQSLREAQINLGRASGAQIDATVGVARAEQNLSDVLNGVAANSQKALAAQRALTDARLDAKEANLQVQQAEQKLSDAQAALADAKILHDPGSRSVADATIAEQQAEIDLTRARENAADTSKKATHAAEDYLTTIHGAPAGSKAARDAENQLHDARKTLTDATNAQIDAEHQVRDAHQEVGDAAISLRRQEQDLTRAWQDAQQAQLGLVRAQQDYTAAVYDAAHATNAAAGAAGGFKNALLDQKKAIVDSEINLKNVAAGMGRLGFETGGARGQFQAMLDTYKQFDAYAHQTLGANNPLTVWLDQQVLATQRILDNLAGINLQVTTLIRNGAGQVLGVNVGGGVQHRAEGGLVKANERYMVGERGWEYFIPKTDGYIVDHASSQRMSRPDYANVRPVTAGAARVDSSSVVHAVRTVLADMPVRQINHNETYVVRDNTELLREFRANEDRLAASTLR